MKQQAITRYLSGSLTGPVILAGTSIFLLLSCHLQKRISPEYIPPKIISDTFISFYPPEAYEKQLEGTVVLLIYVEKNGYVGKAGVSRSSGYDVLDNAALTMARTVRFSPGLVYGKAQDLWMIWPVVFQLSSMPIFTLDLMEWQRMVREFQVTASTQNPLKRRMAQNNLFNYYVKLGNLMAKNRSILPNKIIMEVVTLPVRYSWIEYQNVWPLAFALFQDYINRFPDSRRVSRAERYLVDHITKEIVYLRKASTNGSPIVRVRQQLLNSLTLFLEEHYPDALRQEPT